MTVTDIERLIQAEANSFTFNVTPGQSYPRQVIVYRFPYSGSRTLLGLRPSQWLAWSQDVVDDGASVTFEVINLGQDTNEVRAEANSVIENIKRQAEFVSVDVSNFNKQLPVFAATAFESRKEELLKRNELLHSLGVPVQKAETVPKTFAIDAPKRVVRVKPQAPSTAFKPEPTLDTSVYDDILKVIRHVGVEMERHPSIYEGKDEEALRDFLLMALSPNFDSASGETFNKKGKTDILIRHKNTNVFVAECSIWAGEKKYRDKLNQALSYLTWRARRQQSFSSTGTRIFSQFSTRSRRQPPSILAFGRSSSAQPRAEPAQSRFSREHVSRLLAEP